MEAPSFSDLPFFGANLTDDDCEYLALTKIAPESRESEAELFQTKWFDYRHLHPVRATYLFAHVYEQQVRKQFAQTKDITEAATVRVMSNPDVFESFECIAMWHARRSFDAIGVRYEFGVKFALNRANDRGWGYFPRPNQLYGVELICDMKDAWNALCRDVFQSMDHPRFRTPGVEAGHPDIEGAHRWLVEQVRARRQPGALLSRLIKEGMLSEERANQEFGVEQVRKAMRLFACP